MKSVVWTGSRGWQDIGTIVLCVDGLAKPFFSILGGAVGFDTHVENHLAKLRLPFVVDEPDWDRDGRRYAGFARDLLMLDRLAANPEGGWVIAGWDGYSHGTKGCIDHALSRGLDVWRLTCYQSLNGR